MRWVILLGLALTPSMADEMLAAHNAIRAKLNLPPLGWSEKLAQDAQSWADKLIKDGTFRHPEKSPWGQNLYGATGGEFLPEQVVGAWASEGVHYNWAANRCAGVCGHYTQLVWRDTKEVGCAVARGGGREIWACDYAPPGNYVGKRPY